MKVETIYDHNPSPEEISAYSLGTKERHLAFCEERGNDWISLCGIFSDRGDEENVKRVVAHIPEFWEEYQSGSYNVQLPS